MAGNSLYEEIPNELLQCVEELAKHVHDMWAEEKNVRGGVMVYIEMIQKNIPMPNSI